MRRLLNKLEAAIYALAAAVLTFDFADVIETPTDASKLINDKATNAQIADWIGCGLNTMVLSLVTGVVAKLCVKK